MVGVSVFWGGAEEGRMLETVQNAFSGWTASPLGTSSNNRAAYVTLDRPLQHRQFAVFPVTGRVTWQWHS